MVSNAKKTKHFIATRQKLQHVIQPTLDLYLNGNRVEEAEDEKLLGVRIDNHLTWRSHIEYLFGKLNSRIYLLKRAKGYFNLHCRKLLFNALVKPIFEYCCSVWDNAPNEQLLTILRVQKRCSRLILDARLLDNSAQMFQKLQWLPIDDIIRIKKLSMMFKIVNKKCPDYFTSFRTYIKNTHSYNTRLSSNNALAVPKCQTNAELRTFHASVTRLWNRLDDKPRNLKTRRVLNDGHCDYSLITTRNNIGDAVPSNKNPSITEVASGRRICMGGHSTSNQHKMKVVCTYLQSGDWSKVLKILQWFAMK